MTAPLLHMQMITKDFPGVRALDAVSFDIHRGEIHALCGENGAGKSTLIKILGGVYPFGTYDGQLCIDGVEQQFHSVRDAARAGIAVIHQELTLIPEMTVAENIYLGKEPERNVKQSKDKFCPCGQNLALSTNNGFITRLDNFCRNSD